MNRTISKNRHHIRIPKAKTMFHYLLIYLMLLDQDSCFYYLHQELIRYIVIGICVGLILLKRVKPDHNLFSLLMLLGIIEIFTFITSILNNAGTGTYLMMSISEQLLLAYCTYAYSEKDFVSRYVRVVTFFATISLVMYSIGLIAPDFLLSSLPSYDVGWRYKYNGILFYTARMREMGRNTGIFREPGLYTIVLNSAIFMCLFLKRYISYNIGVVIVVLIACLVTTGSATGYIGLIGIVAAYFLVKTDKEGKKWKRNIRYVILGILMIIIIDYYTRGTSSFLQTYFIEKVSTMNDFTSISTGSVRLGTIILCLTSIVKYPFGIGAINAMKYLSGFGSVGGYEITGARILITTLGIGIIPVTVALIYLFREGYLKHKSVLTLILLIFLYFNTALAQSREFYPALIVLFFIDAGLQKNQRISKRK